MRAIVTVVGKDRVGIIAAVCALPGPAERQRSGHQPDRPARIIFTMVMLVDTGACADLLRRPG